MKWPGEPEECWAKSIQAEVGVKDLDTENLRKASGSEGVRTGE